MPVWPFENRGLTLPGEQYLPSDNSNVTLCAKKFNRAGSGNGYPKDLNFYQVYPGGGWDSTSSRRVWEPGRRL